MPVLETIAIVVICLSIIPDTVLAFYWLGRAMGKIEASQGELEEDEAPGNLEYWHGALHAVT